MSPCFAAIAIAVTGVVGFISGERVGHRCGSRAALSMVKRGWDGIERRSGEDRRRP